MKEEIRNLFEYENVTGFIINGERYKELKDYITNLEQENHNLYGFIYEFIIRLEHIREYGSKTYIKENLDLVIKYMNKEFKEYYKLKELKENDSNE